MSGISETVNWVLNNSVEDVNYDSAVQKLTDAELVYCYRNESRKSAREKLAAEARRRGMDWLVRDEAAGAASEPVQGNRQGAAPAAEEPAPVARQLSIFGEFLPKKEEPKSQAAKRPAPPPRTAVAPVTEEPPKDRPWLVCYAGHRVEIEDPSGLTLEELRKRLEREFPELSAERVTWHWVPPAENGSGRQAERQAAEGAEQPEGGGAPEPLVLVPVVTAGKKGSGDALSRALKGFFWSAAGAMADDHPVQVLAARDGRLYEIRKTPVGVFSRALDFVPELDDWGEGFSFALPRIPAALLEEVLFAFRAALPREAVVQVLWDCEARAYRIGLPEQHAGACSVDFARALLPENLVWVMDIHSHGRLGAYFSRTDDLDEKATGLYAVVGKVHTPFPELRVRYSCGGTYREIRPEQVFELEG